jgi:hypothetical protein
LSSTLCHLVIRVAFFLAFRGLAQRVQYSGGKRHKQNFQIFNPISTWQT